ncbi:Lytic transglycosylase catalytic [Desulfofarcimen acetoxidans DSM 771]|uniref:Lytic transglycosylase catalytic n=2 Tax=Desulfofarcimen acetoxidans TaxID=58138 RepID=C8W6G7_DESAS|nr:Lytic transglycosylase catalytic [Desulfofarcimen acetoxidans DSM 771]
MKLLSLDAMNQALNNSSSVDSQANKKDFEIMLARAMLEKADLNSVLNYGTLTSPNNCSLNRSVTVDRLPFEQTAQAENNIKPDCVKATSDLAVPQEYLPSDKRYDSLIVVAAGKYKINPALLKGLIKAESDFDEAARSRAGALGLTQLMPSTARSLGVNPLKPEEAIEGGAKYLSQMLNRYNGDQALALAAYNAGPGNVDKYGGIPPFRETIHYVKKVTQNADNYSSDFGNPVT